MNELYGKFFFIVLSIFTLLNPVWAKSELDSEIILESEVSNKEPFIGQAILYTLRLWRKSHLQQGYFLKPEVPEALLLEAGYKRIDSVKKNGLDYELLEQNYILIPQKSDKLLLTEAIFSSRKLYLKGQPLSLSVQSPPAHFNQKYWLIAKAVQLTQEWLIPEKSIQAGSIIERIISLKGQGLLGAQFPEIIISAADFTEPEVFTLQKYFDQSEHFIKNNELYGQRTIKYRYVFHHAGQYVIPDITLKWWNSATGKIERQLISGKTFTVLPSQVLPPIYSQGKAPIMKQTVQVFHENQESLIKNIRLMLEGVFNKSGLMVLGVLFIFVMFYLLEKQVKLANGLFRLFKKNFFCVHMRHSMRQAIKKNDYYTMKKLLIQWGQAYYPDKNCTNLVALGSLTEDKLIVTLLYDLDQQLYGNTRKQSFNHRQKELMKFMRCSIRGQTFKSRAKHLPFLW